MAELNRLKLQSIHWDSDKDPKGFYKFLQVVYSEILQLVTAHHLMAKCFSKVSVGFQKF